MYNVSACDSIYRRTGAQAHRRTGARRHRSLGRSLEDWGIGRQQDNGFQILR